MKGYAMQITVVKEFTFDAAHHLPRYDGICSAVHGHRYRLLIGFKDTVHPITGMVIDFAVIKKQIGVLVDKLDHTDLNNVSFMDFPKNNPTAENMVVWIVRNIQASSLAEYANSLVFVRLYETPDNYAEWKKE